MKATGWQLLCAMGNFTEALPINSWVTKSLRRLHKEGDEMISSLRGILIHKDTEGVVVDCSGVGYGVAMPLSCLAHIGEVDSEVLILVHTHVTQDSLRLFGFSNSSRRGVFSSLIGISGVGPKMALAILSMFSPPELADIAARGDKGLLVKIPGVGAKKAAKLLLELKDRLPELPPSSGTARLECRSLYDDLVSALVNLGFQNTVAEDAGRRVMEAAPAENDVALLVKQALQLTTRPN